jgi:hydroxymethylbilane synthase
MRELVIGSRGSALALWQTRRVEEMLRRHHPSIRIRIEIIQTKGDKILDVALSRIGDRALFTKELEQALLDGTIDLAVHSLKDMPTVLPAGLTLGAISDRHGPQDALVAAQGTTLETLSHGATVATSSLRRRAQLLSLRPDLNVVDVRGNVQTRLDRRRQNGWEGMILAFAGLDRLGLTHEIAQIIPTSVMLPAVGQGALAIETRTGDHELIELLQPLDDEETRLCTTAERAFLRALEGGCQVPIAAHATLDGQTLAIDGLVAALDGSTVLRRSIAGARRSAEELGMQLATQLIAEGAGDILAQVRAMSGQLDVRG